MSGLWLLSYLALWGLFLVVALALLTVLRNLGVIYQSLANRASDGNSFPTKLVPGSQLPELKLRSLQGGTDRLTLPRGQKTAVVIVSPRCSPCHSLLREIAAGLRPLDPLDPAVVNLVAISTGDIAATAAFAEQVQLPSSVRFLVDTERLVAQKWGITTTPSTVILDEHLRVVRHIFGAEEPAPAKGGMTVA